MYISPLAVHENSPEAQEKYGYIPIFKVGKNEMSIKNSEIDKLKVREFSVVQTIVFTSTMLLAVLVVSYIADPKVNVPISPTSPN